MFSKDFKTAVPCAGLTPALEKYLQSPARDKSTQNYKNVKVLLVNFEAEKRLAAHSHLNFSRLQDVLGNTYGYSVSQWSIPRDDSQKALSKRVEQFIDEDNDDPSVLKIFYYHGHGGQDEKKYLTFQCDNGNTTEEEERVLWGGPRGIQILLERSRADTIIILDACYSANTNRAVCMREDQRLQDGIGHTWLISASGHNKVSYAGESSLTSILCLALEDLKSVPEGFNLNKLNQRMLTRMEHLTGDNLKYSRAPLSNVIASPSTTNQDIVLMPLRKHSVDPRKETRGSLITKAAKYGGARGLDPTMWAMVRNDREEDRLVLCKLDSGSQVHAISKSVQRRLGLPYEQRRQDGRLHSRRLSTGLGEFELNGTTCCKLQLGDTGTAQATELNLMVLEDHDTIPFDIILGVGPSLQSDAVQAITQAMSLKDRNSRARSSLDNDSKRGDERRQMDGNVNTSAYLDLTSRLRDHHSSRVGGQQVKSHSIRSMAQPLMKKRSGPIPQTNARSARHTVLDAEDIEDDSQNEASKARTKTNSTSSTSWLSHQSRDKTNRHAADDEATDEHQEVDDETDEEDDAEETSRETASTRSSTNGWSHFESRPVLSHSSIPARGDHRSTGNGYTYTAGPTTGGSPSTLASQPRHGNDRHSKPASEDVREVRDSRPLAERRHAPAQRASTRHTNRVP